MNGRKTIKNRIATLLAAATLAVSFAGAASAQDAYSDWDTDGEAGINMEEFHTGFDAGGLYDSWDADGDGSLTSDEFDAGFYDSYDANDDKVIDEPEFGDLGDDMGDGGLFDV